MSKYIHKYTTNTTFETDYYGSSYIEPWVSLTDANGEVNYNKQEKQILLETPLTIVAQGNGVVDLANYTYSNFDIDYRVNNGNWTTETLSGSSLQIPVSSGDEVQFRRNNTSGNTGGYGYQFIDTTCSFTVKGNIMSLISKENFATLKTVPDNGDPSTCGVFFALFNNSLITDASKLQLPATTLAPYCYQMMFNGCTSLTTVPELPATTLAEGCYENMFQECTLLTTAPILPATTLVDYCYCSMFQGCDNINYIKCLATDISAHNCTDSWVYGVSQSGIFIKNASMALWDDGEAGIPFDWVVRNA